MKKPEVIAKGEQAIAWAEHHMPVLAEIRRDYSKSRPLKGLRIGAALHTEAKTAVLVRTLMAAGAKVAIASCNPLSTKDEVAAALTRMGVHVYARRGETQQEYYSNLRRVLSHKPDILIDDGADLVVLAHLQYPKLIERVLGASEETTTGVLRLRAMERERALKIPVIAVNDTPAKRRFDNRFGTAESTLQGIMGITNLQISGKRVVVVGFGFVGRGIASRAKGLGARVTVVEANPIRALEAALEGFEVKPMREAAGIGDIFITATGSCNVIRREHFERMRDGAILCNAGHFNVEIDIEGLRKLAVRRKKTLEDVEEFVLPKGKRVYLLAQGRLVNLAGQRSLGHPIEIMDLSFSLQALSVAYLAEHGSQLEPGVYEVPQEIDEKATRLKLKAMGIELEHLTPEQREYVSSWRFGT
jgi:adenosylhomocysteinase